MLTRDSDPSGGRARLNPPDKVQRPAETLAEARSRREGLAGRGHPARAIWGSVARVGEGRPAFAVWPELGAWWRVGRGHLALGRGEDPRFERSVRPGYWSGFEAQRLSGSRARC